MGGAYKKVIKNTCLHGSLGGFRHLFIFAHILHEYYEYIEY